MSRLAESQLHGTSRETQLPDWKVEPGSKTGTLNITCPRKDCGGKAVVSKRWRESRPNYIGRSCTYCFKVAKIPRKDS